MNGFADAVRQMTSEKKTIPSEIIRNIQSINLFHLPNGLKARIS